MWSFPPLLLLLLMARTNPVGFPNSALIFAHSAFIKLFPITSILLCLLFLARIPHRYNMRVIKNLKSYLPFLLTLHLVSIIICLGRSVCALVLCLPDKQNIYVPCVYLEVLALFITLNVQVRNRGVVFRINPIDKYLLDMNT